MENEKITYTLSADNEPTLLDIITERMYEDSVKRVSISFGVDAVGN